MFCHLAVRSDFIVWVLNWESLDRCGAPSLYQEDPHKTKTRKIKAVNVSLFAVRESRIWTHVVKFVFETPVFLSFGYHRVSFTWEIFWLCAVGEQRSRENSRLQVYVLFNRTLDLLCTILKTLRAARAQFSLSSDFEWITSVFLFPEKKINLCFYCVRRRVAKFVPSKFFNIALWPSSHGEWWVLFFYKTQILFIQLLC